MKFDKNATVELTAPTDGTYEGILLVADRDCKKRNLKLHQTQVSGMVGEIYTPTWKVELKGGKKKNDPPGGFNVSIISKELKIDKHFDAEELDELDEPYLDEFGNPIYDPDYDPAVPNLVFNALSGGSARRIVLGE